MALNLFASSMLKPYSALSSCVMYMYWNRDRLATKSATSAEVTLKFRARRHTNLSTMCAGTLASAVLAIARSVALRVTL